MVKNGLSGIGGLALTPRAPLQVTFRLPIAHPTVGTEEPVLLPSLGSPESDTTERLSTILHQGTFVLLTKYMGFPGNQRPQKSLSSPTWFLQVDIKAVGMVSYFPPQS